eukprot:11213228-Lingulodinium_polyedra.AAC.1
MPAPTQSTPYAVSDPTLRTFNGHVWQWTGVAWSWIVTVGNGNVAPQWTTAADAGGQQAAANEADVDVANVVPW